MIRIRLRRTGKKRHPYYRVVVANKTAKRDGAFLATLGSYDPHASPPVVALDEAKTREWLGKGAQPSEAAEKVLRRAGITALVAVPVAAEANAEAAEEKPASRAKRTASAATAAEKPDSPANTTSEAESAPAAKAARTTKARAEAATEAEVVVEPSATEEES